MRNNVEDVLFSHGWFIANQERETAMKPKTKLATFVAHYRETHTEPLSDGYVRQLEVAVAVLNRYLGKQARLRDLSDELINKFVEWYQQQGRAPDTVRGKRNALMALWRAAHMQEILDTRPERIRMVRARREAPKAWTPEEVSKLRDTALADGLIWDNGIRRGPWFASLVSAAWDSALRLGDLLELQQSNVRRGPFTVNQSKTKHDVTVCMSNDTLMLIEETLADGRDNAIIWPLWARRDQFFLAFRRLVRAAGITRGTFKYLRRSAITAVEVQGGNGSLLAGHKSRAITERHYIDPTHLPLTTPNPLKSDRRL